MSELLYPPFARNAFWGSDPSIPASLSRTREYSAEAAGFFFHVPVHRPAPIGAFLPAILARVAQMRNKHTIPGDEGERPRR
jgi:hypothetical protein